MASAQLWLLVGISLLWGVNGYINDVVDSSKVILDFDKLVDIVDDIHDEISQYFAKGSDLKEWHRQNAEALADNAKQLLEVKENITATTTILNYTQTFDENVVQLSLERESSKSLIIEGALKQLTERAEHASSTMNSSEKLLAEGRASHAAADGLLREAQARLQGLRAAFDALLQREGALRFRLAALRDALLAQQSRADKVFEGQRKAKEEMDNVKKRVKETEETINKFQDTITRNKQLQIVKSRKGALDNVTAVPSLNYIKSIKTASGRGKTIKLVLLSD